MRTSMGSSLFQPQPLSFFFLTWMFPRTCAPSLSSMSPLRVVSVRRLQRRPVRCRRTPWRRHRRHARAWRAVTPPFTVEASCEMVDAFADAQLAVDGAGGAELHVFLDHDLTVDRLGFVGRDTAADAHLAVHGAQGVVGFAGRGFDRSIHRRDASSVARDTDGTGCPGDESQTGQRKCRQRISWQRPWRAGDLRIRRGERAGLHRGARLRLPKKKPRFRGAYWSLACLFVEECFRSSCCCPMRSLSSRLPKKEQALCQRNLTAASGLMACRGPARRKVRLWAICHVGGWGPAVKIFDTSAGWFAT